jgi:hypothetical protein
MTQAVPASPASSGTVSTIVVTAPRPAQHSAFHDLLSELNPLQYIPVVGTIYRAITGDKIPEEARAVGSLVLSGMTGGPGGIAISAAAMALEKVTGIDPEKLGQHVLAQIGIGGEKSPAAPATPLQLAITQPKPELSPTTSVPAWSAAQLTAYGVTTTPGGSLKQGNLLGSDVLNNLELTRLASAAGGEAVAEREDASKKAVLF